jgi:3-oxo-5-alpha-steroid 4-dehydrogenase 1
MRVTELAWHGWAVRLELALAAVTALALTFVVAPYGRHARAGWGPTLPAKVGWAVMESPAVVLFGALFFAGDHRRALVPLVLLGLWQFHYVQRAFVYPFRMRAGARIPLFIVVLAVAFNTLNAYVNARWIGLFGTYPLSWLADTRFLAGAALFLAGWLGNVRSDAILRGLRRPGETGYHIPHGGLYRWVSAPNYLCEMVEWTGWAVATWSTAGLAFAIYTAANLAPRALSHHAWYRARFPDYPVARKALIPFVR